MKYVIAASITALLLTGCQAPVAPEPAAPPSAPAPAENTELLQAIQTPQDKARALEQQLQEEHERKQAEMDAQGG